MRQKRVPILPMLDKDQQRFWKLIDKTGNCHLWLAHKNQGGYGMFRTYQRTPNGTKRYKVISMLAHRVVWSLTHNAEIHEDLVMRHQCHNPLCCNPDHLLTGTHLDNHNDMVKAGRGSHLAYGPMNGIVGANHPASKYDQTIRDHALELMFGVPPMLLIDIAKKLGISNKTLGRWRAEYLGSKDYRWCRPGYHKL